MKRNIKILEERVSRAADRLRELADERTRLEDEVRTLRERISALEGQPAEGEAWQGERDQVIASIHQTLDELRVD